MSLISSIIQNTPDPVVLPAGTRVRLILQKATFGATKGGTREDGTDKPIRPIIKLYCKVEGQPLVGLISDNLWFPLDSDAEDVQVNQNQKIKGVMAALKINPKVDGDIDPNSYKPDMEPVVLANWVGKTGEATLGQDEDAQGLPRNFITNWLKPPKAM